MMNWLLGNHRILTRRSLVAMWARRAGGGSPTPAPDPWTVITPLDGGPDGGGGSFFRGVVTQQADGSHRVTTASGNANGRALVEMPVMPAGTRILLEYSIQFDGASRLILRQVENNDSTAGVTVFDVQRATFGPVYTGSIQFNVLANRRFLHFIGVTPTGQFFTINPATRWRIAPTA